MRLKAMAERPLRLAAGNQVKMAGFRLHDAHIGRRRAAKTLVAKSLAEGLGGFLAAIQAKNPSGIL